MRDGLSYFGYLRGMLEFEPIAHPASRMAGDNTPISFGTGRHGVPGAYRSPIDLNRELVHFPESTFFCRVVGESLLGEAVHDGDVLIVDRSRPYRPGDMVVAFVDDHMALRRIGGAGGSGVYLESECERVDSIEILPHDDGRVWGVVTYVIHRVSH